MIVLSLKFIAVAVDYSLGMLESNSFRCSSPFTILIFMTKGTCLKMEQLMVTHIPQLAGVTVC